MLTEYQHILIDARLLTAGPECMNSLDGVANEYGSAGWELFSQIPISQPMDVPGLTTHILLCFKRQKAAR